MMSTLKNLLLELAVITCLVILLPITVTFLGPIFLLLLLLRALVWALARLFRPDLQEFVTQMDASYALRDHPALNKTNLVNTMILDGVVSLDKMRTSFQKNVFDANDETRAFVKYKKTWTSFLGWAFWKDADDLKLENYITYYDNEIEPPLPIQRKDLGKLLGPLLRQPWINRRRSPWQFILIPIVSEDGRNQTAVIMRSDHVLGDGISAVILFENYFQTKMPIPVMNGGKRKLHVWEKMALLAKIPYDTIKSSLMVFGSSKLLVRNVLALTEDVVGLSPYLDVAVVKDIKDHFKVSYASVIYAAIFGAIQQALILSGIEVPKELVCAFPVPLPNHPQGLFNHFSLLLSKWPIKCASPVDRLMKIDKTLKKLRGTTAPIGVLYLTRLCGYLPICLRRIVLGVAMGNTASMACSNFPVSTGPSYFENAEFLEYIGCHSTVPPIGLLVLAGGINNDQRINFSISKSLGLPQNVMENLGNYAVEQVQVLVESTTTSMC